MSEEFDKSTILESFLDEVNAYLPEIEANLDRLQQDPGNTEALEETYRRTHTIGGSAAMMDFNGLAHVAQGMEEILGDALDTGTPLPAATVSLLRRSQGRLAKLIDSVRTGNDNSSIVADDDADRSASRGSSFGSSSVAIFDTSPIGSDPSAASGMHGGGASNGSNGSGAISSVQLPDWLSAFAGPDAEAFGAFSQPGAPANGLSASNPLNGASPAQPGQWSGSSVSDMPTGAMPTPGFASPTPSGPQEPFQQNDPWAASGQTTPFNPMGGGPGFNGAASQPSAPMNTAPPSVDPWQASRPGADVDVSEMGTGIMPSVTPPPPSAPMPTQPPAFGQSGVDEATQALPWLRPNDPGAISQPPPPPLPSYPPEPAPRVTQSPPLIPGSAGAMETSGLALSALDELRVDEEAVHRQVATLRDVVVQLREAAQAMEDERAELRGFLDGSSDALDRLEEWAGSQMGLDLQSSPETVRRYLPLSVLWVTTTRLKNLVSLLHGSGRTLTLTQEQIEESLGELRSAVESVGTIYRSIASTGAPGEGFSATVAHFAWTPPQTADAPSISSPSASTPSASGEQSLTPAARI